jgi:NAD(P)-dependent dehydrogenase (short-subunit alcohol dehydrogenase family)
MTDYRGKVVVVTGASAGVGRATAIAFARHGARVALLARGEAGLAGAAAEVRAAGGEALVLSVDVADAAQVEAAAARVESELGPIEVWVNDAMVTVFSPVSQMRPEEYRRVTEVTYLGTVHGTLAALRHMRPRNRGSIVQVGSALAYRAIPLQSAYCGAKFAVRGFTDSLRTELLHENSAIRLCMVQLSAFNTPQFQWARTRMRRCPQPTPPIYQPELAARAIVWAAARDRREISVGFPAVKAILASWLAPGLADRLLARQGISSQQTEEPLPADRPDNLERPIERDLGAHGRFDEGARTHSLQLWTNMNRGWLLGGVALASVALGWRLWRRR